MNSWYSTKKFASFGAAAALAATLSFPAAAEKSSIPGTFSANVGFVSEYFFRGLSQSDDGPAVQGGFDYELELSKPVSLYLGVWGSNVDFNDGNDGATLETDVYGGLTGEIGKTGVSWDLGFIYYAYPGAANNLDYDFVEVQGALGYDFGPAAVTVSLNYSPNNFGDSGDAFYPKLAVDAPFPGVENLSLSAYVAKQYIDKEAVFGSPDYLEWNIGASYAWSGFDIGLAYSDTDISPSGDGNSEAVIFSVSRSF